VGESAKGSNGATCGKGAKTVYLVYLVDSASEKGMKGVKREGYLINLIVATNINE
jgi:hypothetical protein